MTDIKRLDGVLQNLAESTPAAFGAVLCDEEGETVALYEGCQPPPLGLVARVETQFPRALARPVSAAACLIRWMGSEWRAVSHGFQGLATGTGAGPTLGLELNFSEFQVLVRPLPEDYALCLFLRPPSVMALARRSLERAGQTIIPHLLAEAVKPEGTAGKPPSPVLTPKQMTSRDRGGR